MDFYRQLIKTELVGLALIAACAAMLSLYAAIDAELAGDATYSPIDSAGMVFGFALAVGIWPLLLFVGPAFAAFHWAGRATWPCALAIGFIPGLVLLIVKPEMGALPMLVFGPIVTGAIRWLLGQGSNNSFKPKPLRGSA